MLPGGGRSGCGSSPSTPAAEVPEVVVRVVDDAPGIAGVAARAHVGQVRRHRRQRPRDAAAARGRGADGALPRSVSRSRSSSWSATTSTRGRRRAEDYRRKFEEPYRALLDEGVKFYAVLGNHDDPRQVDYEPFNMHGERYYTLRAAGRSPDPDRHRGRVLRARLDESRSRAAARGSTSGWPPRRGVEDLLLPPPALHVGPLPQHVARIHRLVLEPILIEHGVDAVFSGHEHIYQRSDARRTGSSISSAAAPARCAPGDGAPASFIARTYRRATITSCWSRSTDEALHFQAMSRRA